MGEYSVLLHPVWCRSYTYILKKRKKTTMAIGEKKTQKLAYVEKKRKQLQFAIYEANGKAILLIASLS